MARNTATPKKGSGPALHPEEQKDRAVRAFRKYQTIKHAAAAIEVHRTTIHRWKRTDPEFAAAMEDAEEDGTDDLEREAIRRAKDGSDTLLIFLLKARRRERYGERPTMAGKHIPVDEFEEFLHELAQAVDRAARASIPDSAIILTHLEAVGREWMALLAARYPDIAATVRHDRDAAAPIERRLPAGDQSE